MIKYTVCLSPKTIETKLENDRIVGEARSSKANAIVILKLHGMYDSVLVVFHFIASFVKSVID